MDLRVARNLHSINSAPSNSKTEVTLMYITYTYLIFFSYLILNVLLKLQACRNFYDDGVCKQECPPMQRYNPIKYKWEKNPNGKYAYGATCVRDCPKHLLKDNGACVRVCPSNKKTVDGECVPCNGPCPKTCHFSEIIHAGNIEKLKNCTVIEGKKNKLKVISKLRLFMNCANH